MKVNIIFNVNLRKELLNLVNKGSAKMLISTTYIVYMPEVYFHNTYIHI